MLGFNHTFAGSIVAIITPAPFVPAAALISHFLLDMVPHFGNSSKFQPYNRSFKLLLLIDAMLCFSVLFASWYFFPDKWMIISIGALFATLPDFMWLLRGRVAWLNGFFKFAEKIQWSEHSRGWLIEILCATCFISALIYIYVQ